MTENEWLNQTAPHLGLEYLLTHGTFIRRKAGRRIQKAAGFWISFFDVSCDDGIMRPCLNYRDDKVTR